MRYCPRCKKEVRPITKLGGKICSKCRTVLSDTSVHEPYDYSKFDREVQRLMRQERRKKNETRS